MEKVDILGISFDNLTTAQVVKKVQEFISSSKKHYIVTPNPEFVVLAQSDNEFAKILNNADLVLPDGVGVVLASKLLNKPLSQRVTGADLVTEMLKKGEEEGYRFFFLGGRGDSAKKAREQVLKKYPKLEIGWYSGEPYQGFDEKARNEIKRFASSKWVDVLLVSYGQGKQERWIQRNLEKIPVKLAIGVGGVIDYLSGSSTRAPKIVREAGFEWLFRLLAEPWRWKRQLALPRFAYLVLRKIFKR